MNIAKPSSDARFPRKTNLRALFRTLAAGSREADREKGPGKRGLTLERMCSEEVRNFESSVAQLVALNAELRRKIELSIMIEESVSPSSDRR